MRKNLPSSPPHRFAQLGVICLIGFAMFLAIADPAMAGDRPSKLERQIDVMAGAIDDMLVDSPNFLVTGRQVAEGFEIDDYGALFSFRASLTGPGWDGGAGHWLSNFWPWHSDGAGKIFILKNEGEGDDEIDLDEGSIIIRDGSVCIMSKDGKDFKKLIKEGKAEAVDKKELQKMQQEKYGRAKEELIGVLMDYGEILKGLPSGQTVRVVARLHDMNLPKDLDITRLSISASINDLRSYGDGKISESEMRGRVKIKES